MKKILMVVAIVGAIVALSFSTFVMIHQNGIIEKQRDVITSSCQKQDLINKKASNVIKKSSKLIMMNEDLLDMLQVFMSEQEYNMYLLQLQKKYGTEPDKI